MDGVGARQLELLFNLFARGDFKFDAALEHPCNPALEILLTFQRIPRSQPGVLATESNVIRLFYQRPVNARRGNLQNKAERYPILHVQRYGKPSAESLTIVQGYTGRLIDIRPDDRTIPISFDFNENHFHPHCRGNLLGQSGNPAYQGYPLIRIRHCHFEP